MLKDRNFKVSYEIRAASPDFSFVYLSVRSSGRILSTGFVQAQVTSSNAIVLTLVCAVLVEVAGFTLT